MRHRFVCLIAATLAFAAAPPAVTSASPVRRPVEVVDILVDGTPQPRFAHGGRWYVEARKGREYTIRLRNPYPVRVAVALSSG
jgi:predicted secreted protein